VAIGQGPTGLGDEDQLAHLDERELSQFRLRRRTPPLSGYAYGGSSRDPKVMYPLNEADVAKVADMIDAKMQPQEIINWLDGRVDQEIFRIKE
jgi:hypothetical protein